MLPGLLCAWTIALRPNLESILGPDVELPEHANLVLGWHSMCVGLVRSLGPHFSQSFISAELQPRC
ncbi:MAG: hypothetical protein NZ739_09745, partial [Verrucomicrobiae bacterium]|nr:hypothetical protein [Verrucomicrobiae bacterium]